MGEIRSYVEAAKEMLDKMGKSSMVRMADVEEYIDMKKRSVTCKRRKFPM